MGRWAKKATPTAQDRPHCTVPNVHTEYSGTSMAAITYSEYVHTIPTVCSVVTFRLSYSRNMESSAPIMFKCEGYHIHYFMILGHDGNNVSHFAYMQLFVYLFISFTSQLHACFLTQLNTHLYSFHSSWVLPRYDTYQQNLK